MEAKVKQLRVNRDAVLRGLEDVVDHLEGRLDLRPEPVDIPQQNTKEIRDNLKMSQSQFAGRFGIPLSNIKNWEQGRRVPDQPANVLLYVISRMPEKVAECLRQKDRDKE